MTNEEARRILLSDSDFSGVGEKAKLTADALCVAVEALEKQNGVDCDKCVNDECNMCIHWSKLADMYEEVSK